MFTKTKIALSVAIILGAASAALAGAKDDEGGERGGFVIAGSTAGVNPAYHRNVFGSAGSAYGYVPSWNQTQSAKRTNGR